MSNESLQLIQVTKDPYNAGTPLPILLEDVTPLNLVYVRNHFDVPKINIREWSLSVGGATKNTLSLSYDEIRALPAKTIRLVLECAGNGRKSMKPIPKGTAWDYEAISVVEFTGTALQSVLKMAGLPDKAVEVAFHGSDHGEVEPERVEKYARGLPLEAALHPDTILAWEMNGQTLTPNHGFPLRLVVPGWYGMASVKWLNKIEVLTEPFKGFFQNEHYIYLDEEGTQQGTPVQNIRPRALFASPGYGEEISQQEIGLTGIAWSGYGKIALVEVSQDGGDSWSTAKLDPQISEYSVQKWRYRWTPESPGSYTLVVRATDSLGNSQPSAQIWNRLGYGNNGPHKIVVSVV